VVRSGDNHYTNTWTSKNQRSLFFSLIRVFFIVFTSFKQTNDRVPNCFQKVFTDFFFARSAVHTLHLFPCRKKMSGVWSFGSVVASLGQIQVQPFSLDRCKYKFKTEFALVVLIKSKAEVSPFH